MGKCSTRHHEALKASAQFWIALDYVGVQVIEADEELPEERLELRNCACGSTLAKRVND